MYNLKTPYLYILQKLGVDLENLRLAFEVEFGDQQLHTILPGHSTLGELLTEAPGWLRRRPSEDQTKITNKTAVQAVVVKIIFTLRNQPET